MADLAFDPATQSELDAHVTNGHSALSAFPPWVGYEIVEDANTPGVWSRAVPVRAPGANPVTVVSLTDPRDATNGLPGMENWQFGIDRWIKRPS